MYGVEKVNGSLFEACAGNHLEVAELLLEDINARDLEFKETPLAAAVRHESRCSAEGRPKLDARRRRMVEFLLRRGAATSLPRGEPWATPLAWARRRGLAAIEVILRRHGAQE